MTYDLKVILKYCGRSSHDLLVLCGWSWLLSGPLLAVLCYSRSLCWRSWPTLGISVGGPGLLLGLRGRAWPLSGPMLAVLGRSWGSIGGLGCTGAALGAYVGDPGPLLGLYWRSWASLGAAVCGPGPLLEPMLAVLSRSWNLCWRSWAALGAYVGGLGPLLGPMWAVWGRKMRRTWLP